MAIYRDEESGMTGAMNLQTGFFEGRTLLNSILRLKGSFLLVVPEEWTPVGTIHFNGKPVQEECDRNVKFLLQGFVVDTRVMKSIKVWQRGKDHEQDFS